MARAWSRSRQRAARVPTARSTKVPPSAHGANPKPKQLPTTLHRSARAVASAPPTAPARRSATNTPAPTPVRMPADGTLARPPTTIRVLDADELVEEQRASLRLDEHAGLATPEALASFVAEVGLALRYGPSDGLPVASVYAAVRRWVPRTEPEADAQRRAIAATNALIDAGRAVEINVVADRLAVVDAALVAPLITLVRCGRTADELELSEALQLPERVVGRIRPLLRWHAVTRTHEPRGRSRMLDQDVQHATRQRAMVIDRGATDVPESGAAYLSKDGTVDRRRACAARRRSSRARRRCHRDGRSRRVPARCNIRDAAEARRALQALCELRRDRSRSRCARRRRAARACSHRFSPWSRGAYSRPVSGPRGVALGWRLR